MKTTNSIAQITILFSIISTTIMSCKKDEQEVTKPQPIENESEVITTMKITFVDAAGVLPTTTATFRDADGDGGNSPTVHDTITLQHNTTYQASILLLDETKNPIDTISNEVLEESVDHLFCFSVADVPITIIHTDTDGTYEVGLQSDWTTGAVGTGSVTVTLRHQPGVKNGTCDPGETDVEVDFLTQLE